VVNTPKGTVFLGSNGQVYLLPYRSVQIIPIGHNIMSNRPEINGLEGIPPGQLPEVCAVYHDGFYKLAFAESGTATNGIQYWLDVDRMQQNQMGHWGPWYGPMSGMSISVFVNQSGSGDDGKLIGGNDNATGYVYDMNDVDTYTDDGTAIAMTYQSRHEMNPGYDSRIMRTEMESKDQDNDVTMIFEDTIQTIGSSVQIATEKTGISWDDYYWDDVYWESSGITARRIIEYYDQLLIGRHISTKLNYSSSTDRFELYYLIHELMVITKAMRVEG